MNPFHVALTADFFEDDDRPKFDDMGLSLFDGAAHIDYVKFDEHRPLIAPDQFGNAHGVIVLTPKVTVDTVASADNLLAVGRFGVGYDTVDVPACTAADVVAYITAGAVDRPVAEATVGWMIALSHHMLIKDRIVRNGNWHDRANHMGAELRDRTFGAVGFGGIARATVGLLKTFTMNPPMAFDPYLDESVAAVHGVRLVTLDELLAEADFVSLHCPLTDETRNLIGARELGLMKRDAWLLNMARGGIVDEDALYDVLSAGRIAGAALDCFIDEPLTAPHRLSELDNVIMAPHSIAWTGEMFRDVGTAVCQGMVDLSHGKRPHGVVNPQVFDKPSFIGKWSRLIGQEVSA